ncbi:CGI-121-domain-containing protein [Durotheca rogersii]|uniref:CGI-121-domain-containing protein n=1 Tax=Durotheca rogersii TaxID=419775 RepID=UPI00221FC12D|nr:CGI-121-domain-containing protein [Durotheca rogersii]KAI5865770.1 CGI-121-domain-containing protein [Durotheca rogersii]
MPPPADAAPELILEPIQIEHVPATHTVHVAVFRDVTNAAFLHEQLLGRNAAFEYALIDASSVVSRLHVLAAAYKAVSALLAGALRTPNVHSEIVCALSPNNNISEAYRRFGVTPATRHLVVVKVLVAPSALTPDAVRAHLRAHVAGVPVPFADAALRGSGGAPGLADWPKVRRYYKLNGIRWLDDLADADARAAETEALVLGAMALRGL